MSVPTIEELRADARYDAREANRGPEACERCGDWVADHPRCLSCNAVVCKFGLCAGCTERSKDECADAIFRLEPILRDMKSGLMLADEVGERLSEIAYRLSTWDVLPNPNTAAGIEDAEARASAAVPEGLRAA